MPVWLNDILPMSCPVQTYTRLGTAPWGHGAVRLIQFMWCGLVLQRIRHQPLQGAMSRLLVDGLQLIIYMVISSWKQVLVLQTILVIIHLVKKGR